MITKFFPLFIAFVLGVSPSSAGTDEPLAISWSDLRPVDQVKSPYNGLSQQQRQDLSHFVRVHRLIAENRLDPKGRDAKEAAESEHRLRKFGIDVEWLLSQREQVRRMHEIQTKSVRQELVGKTIELTGFVLPLKISHKLVTEFLLVPNVDVCAHSPLPPPNQLIFVKVSQGLAVNHGRFTTVQVKGRLESTRTSRTLLRETGPTKTTAAYSIAKPSVRIIHGKAESDSPIN